MRFLFALLFLPCLLWAEGDISYCTPANFDPVTRSDNIPVENTVCMSDEYLTGYVQALIDMHYYEFQVQVVVRNGRAFIFNLPYNDLLAESIVSFVGDVPGICAIECVDEECDCIYDPLPVPCSSPCDRISGIWFPQSTVLFAPLVADPRQVTNSAALRFNDDVIGKHVGAVSFGDEFIFYRWRDVGIWHGELEAGIEAGIFSVFDLDHTRAAMVNTDFFVALLIDYALNKWSWRFRWWHLSSHIGDEFLLSNPGFARRNLSDEGVDLFVSYQICQPIRLYLGVGDIYSRDKEFQEHPVYVEWGSEIRVFGERDYFNRLYVQPFLAMHFRTWEEHDWDIDQTYALGLEWSKVKGVGKKVRFFLEYHQGYSKEGQFVRDRTDYAAIRMEYGF